jgi:hypothetical protein
MVGLPVQQRLQALLAHDEEETASSTASALPVDPQVQLRLQQIDARLAQLQQADTRPSPPAALRDQFPPSRPPLPR